MGGLVDLVPQTKLQTPQIETCSTILKVLNQWSFSQFLEYQAPPHKRKPPYRKLSSDRACCLFIFCPQEAQFYPNETRVEILTRAVAWHAQNFGWSKCLISGEQQYFV